MESELVSLKSDLRARLLGARAGLSEPLRLRLDRQICTHVLRLLEAHDCLDLAGYLPFRGEPDLRPALAALQQAGRRIWLPVVDGDRLRFRRWRADQPLQTNRFGIPEPADGPECAPDRLQLVLTPTVGFSIAGTRLGMGAGYYDRCFAFLRETPGTGPLLIAVAYAMQEVDSLPRQTWDVPLAGVLTERGLRMFRE